MNTEKYKNLSLRLLGYYNTENQSMQPETEKPEEAAALAELLSVTFEDMNDINNDPDFESARQNGVFLLRDRDSNLFAYFPKGKIAKVTGVVFNREELVMLPLEYKNWFIPGEELVITKAGESTNPMPNQFFFDYLRGIGSIGEQVVLSSDFLIRDKDNNGFITGELVAIGKNFIRIKENKTREDIIISDHMCLKINPVQQHDTAREEVIGVDDDDDVLVPAMGIITSFYKDKNGNYVGNIKRYKDHKVLGLRQRELLESEIADSPIGKVVLFSERQETYPNGKSWIQATFVHRPGKVSELLSLADSLMNSKRRDAAREVLQHVLDYDPDNQDAINRMDAYSINAKQIEPDPDTKQFNKANELIKDGHYEEAIPIYEELLKKGSKVKDSIPKLTVCYWLQYDHESDPESKEVYRKSLCDFITNNHTKLNPSMSRNIRLNYYYKLRYDNLYLNTIDSVLQDPSSDVNRRAQMFALKAQLYKNNGEMELALRFAEESMYLKPFNNKAELMLLPELTEPSVPVDNGLLARHLLKSPIDVSMTPDQLEENLARLEKSSSDYNKSLLALSVIYSRSADENAKKKSIYYVTEYIANMAGLLAQEKKYQSAVYCWGEFFSSFNGFGYFAQLVFSRFIASILKVDIIKDVNIEIYKPWENMRTWKELLLMSSAMKSLNTQSGWYPILYVIRDNQVMQKELAQFILDNEEVKQLFATVFKASNLDLEVLLSLFHNNANHYVKQDLDAKSQTEQALTASNIAGLSKGLESLLSKGDLFPKKSISSSHWDCFCDDCLPIIQRYVVESDVVSRIQLAREIIGKINSLKTRINSEPTKYGIESLWDQIINKTLKLINNNQKQIIKESQPFLSVEIFDSPLSPDENGLYHVQGQISNGERLLPAEDVVLTISSLTTFTSDPQEMKISKIEGSQVIGFEFLIKLSNSAAKKTNWIFAMSCSYISGDVEKRQLFENLQVRLEHGVVFRPILKNPYTYGPAISLDDPTFVGRKKEMKEIMDMVLHPQRKAYQIILYGQKRCGKSTLVKAVISELEKLHPDEVFCVYKTLSIDSKKNEIYDDRKFYLTLLRSIRDSLKGDGPRPVIKVPTIKEMKSVESPTDLFNECIMDFKSSMKSIPGWENKRLVLIVDEFTTLYNSIKQGKASQDILHHWKAIQESDQTNFVTIFVGHDITKSFLDEKYAANANRILERYQLSYLEKKDAVELIERPILQDGKSRFNEEAIDRILFYTGRNPYYLQIFMKRMVDYINEKKISRVSDMDVYYVAQQFISRNYEEFTTEADFDNLINNGLNDKFTEYKDKEIVMVLRAIARLSEGQDWCDGTLIQGQIKRNVKIFGKMKTNKILKDLDDRKVIEWKKDPMDSKRVLYRIKIGLFKEWLNQN